MDWARIGAVTRLEQLKTEIDAILAAFPDLRSSTQANTGGATTRATASSSVSAATPVRRRRRPKMTPAQRKAVGERMRKYWAERRKAKKG